jgi:hypothetical protein
VPALFEPAYRRPAVVRHLFTNRWFQVEVATISTRVSTNRTAPAHGNFCPRSAAR